MDLCVERERRLQAFYLHLIRSGTLLQVDEGACEALSPLQHPETCDGRSETNSRSAARVGLMSDTSLPPHEDFVETLKRWEQERKAAEAFEAKGRRAAPKEQRVVTTGFKFAVPGHGDIALPALTYGDFHWLKDVLAMEAKL